MPQKPFIFLSYRRNDAKTAAGELHKILSRAYGPESVFRDVTTKGAPEIRGGREYPEELRNALRKSDAVIVIIGPHWLRESHEGETDWVIEEVSLALKKRARNKNFGIYPVLVEGADFPVKDLPAEIKGLEKLQAVPLRPESFRADVTRLLRDLPKAPEAEPISPKNLSRLQLAEAKQQHQDRVSSLLWSADGKTLVSAADDGSVAWWKGSTARSRPGHEQPVRALAFTPDQKTVVSLSADRLRMSSTSAGVLQTETPLIFDDAKLFGFTISPTDPYFVVAAVGSDPVVCSIPEADEVSGFPNRSTSDGVWESARVFAKIAKPFVATAMAFSTDGAWFIGGSIDGTVAVWDVETVKLLWSTHVTRKAIEVLAVSPKGQLLAASEGIICLFQMASGAEWHVESAGSQITGAAFTGNSELVVCTCANRAPLFVDISARSVLPVSVAGMGVASAVAVSPDATRIAMGTLDGKIQMWSIG